MVLNLREGMLFLVARLVGRFPSAQFDPSRIRDVTIPLQLGLIYPVNLHRTFIANQWSSRR